MNKFFGLLWLFWASASLALPPDFVYLKDVDPSIIQDIRYASDHNFVGHPIEGYHQPACILTRQAALALQRVQTLLKPHGMTLKVYDCYRPVCAVRDFYHWSALPNATEMKAEFYPRINKNQLFSLGYIAISSGHSRGSTIDLTLVKRSHTHEVVFEKDRRLVSCFAPWSIRFRDNSIDMGCGYDCMDRIANGDNKEIGLDAQENRAYLKKMMIQNGFKPYAKEWWHFTLKKEPYPSRYYNFPIE